MTSYLPLISADPPAQSPAVVLPRIQCNHAQPRFRRAEGNIRCDVTGVIATCDYSDFLIFDHSDDFSVIRCPFVGFGRASPEPDFGTNQDTVGWIWKGGKGNDDDADDCDDDDDADDDDDDDDDDDEEDDDDDGGGDDDDDNDEDDGEDDSDDDDDDGGGGGDDGDGDGDDDGDCDDGGGDGDDDGDDDNDGDCDDGGGDGDDDDGGDGDGDGGRHDETTTRRWLW